MLFIVINLHGELSQGETVACFILEKLFSRLEICDLFTAARDNTEKVIKGKTHDDLIGDLTCTSVRTDVHKSGKNREETSLILA
jgi:hypothetical protein